MNSFNTDQSVNTEQTADQLTFKVGEREYSQEDAVKKIANADEHISKIQAENQELRDKQAALEAQVAQSTKIEEALAKLSTQQQSQESLTIPQTDGMSEEQIGAIAENTLKSYLEAENTKKAEAEAISVAEKTFKETLASLQVQFGDKVDDQMKAYSQESGIPYDTLVKTAQDPSGSKLLLSALKVTTPRTEHAPSSSFNINAGVQQEKNPIDWKKFTSKDIHAKLIEARAAAQ